MSHKRKSLPSSAFSPSSFDAVDGVVDDLRPRRAFRVSGSPDFSQAEPQSAEEYLRRVRWEAQHQPKSFTAPVNPAQWKGGEGGGKGLRPSWGKGLHPLPPTSPLAMPSKEWQQNFTGEFTSVRLAFLRFLHIRTGEEEEEGGKGGSLREGSGQSPPPRPRQGLPPMRDYPAWLRFCLGRDVDVERCIRGGGEEGAQVTPSMTPDLHTVAAWDQVTTRGVLHHLIDHLNRCHQRVTDIHNLERRSPTHNSPAKAYHTEDEEMKENTEEDEEEEEEEEEDEVVVTERGFGTVLSPKEATFGEMREASPVGVDVLSSSSSSPVSFLHLPRPSHMMWLYAALVHLEKPLPADVDVQLRQLYRVCGKIRAEAGRRLEELQQTESGGEGSGEGGVRDRRSVLDCAMHCNLLMTIVDKVFGQRMEMQRWTGG